MQDDVAAPIELLQPRLAFCVPPGVVFAVIATGQWIVVRFPHRRQGIYFIPPPNHPAGGWLMAEFVLN